jgi:UDP-glucose 4-epimerase
VDNLVTGERRNLATVEEGIDWVVLDLTRDDLRPLLGERRPDTLFHLAANGYVPASVEDPRMDFERNAIGTFNVLEAVRDAAPEARIVHTSSAAVYGEGEFLNEDDPTWPVAPCGVSKLAAERYVAVYARVYGLRTVNVRLFPVYGPRLRRQVVYDLIRKVHANPHELFIYGDGTQIRDFNHVANVVEALTFVASRSASEGEVYNVAADEPVAIRDLAMMLCERMAVSPRFVYSGDVRTGDAQRWGADTSRLTALGYRPRLTLAEGLTDTVAWFLRETGDA